MLLNLSLSGDSISFSILCNYFYIFFLDIAFSPTCLLSCSHEKNKIFLSIFVCLIYLHCLSTQYFVNQYEFDPFKEKR